MSDGNNDPSLAVVASRVAPLGPAQDDTGEGEDLAPTGRILTEEDFEWVGRLWYATGKTNLRFYRTGIRGDEKVKTFKQILVIATGTCLGHIFFAAFIALVWLVIILLGINLFYGGNGAIRLNQNPSQQQTLQAYPTIEVGLGLQTPTPYSIIIP